MIEMLILLLAVKYRHYLLISHDAAPAEDRGLRPYAGIHLDDLADDDLPRPRPVLRVVK